MRTLSAGLLAAQQADSISPSVRSILDSVIYGPTRIVYAKMIERPFGSVLYITLRNDDLTRTGEYRGNIVELRWGATFGGGPTTEWSMTQPFYPVSARHISADGELLLELICVDQWQWLSLQSVVGGGGVKLTGTITGVLKPGDRVTGLTSGAIGTVNAVGIDFVTVGHVSETADFEAFGEVVEADGNSANYITASFAAEYGRGPYPVWPGDTTIIDIITALCSGAIDVVLDSSDGVVDSVAHMPYYIVGDGASITDVVKELMALTSCGYRFENDYKLHIFDCSSTPSPEDYEYELGGDHEFDSNIREASSVLPNKVICLSVDIQHIGLYQYSGEANDAASQTRWSFMGNGISDGVVTEVIWQRCSSDQACEDFALARLLQINREAYKGEFICPIMNVGQELFDYVKVINPVDGVTSYGWVGMIERTWDEKTGDYSMRVGLGNLAWAEQLPPNIPYDPMPPNFPQPPSYILPDIPDLEVDFGNLPKAIQGYHHDITFSATNYYIVAWTSGTITFYDGTTQAIASGNSNMGDRTIRHVYFDLDDASPNVLKVSTDYPSVMTQYTGVVCLIQRASTTSIDAMFIPSYGKQPLITADVIFLTGLFDVLNSAGGNSYGAVLSTYMTAGQIKLSATLKDGDWYNESGVEISATTGIQIYGSGAFTTRPSKDGTIQCSVDSSGYITAGAGNVILWQGGIELKSNGSNTELMSFKYGSGLIAKIHSTGTGLVIEGASGKDIFLSPQGAGKLVLSSAVTTVGELQCWSSFYIDGRAAAAPEVTGYGQLWIKNTSPCELWFTDDAGTDTQIV